MATRITIAKAPDEERIASRQSIADWLQSRDKSDYARVPASAILRARDADRK